MYGNEGYLRDLVREEAKRQEKNRITSAWYNPTPYRVKDKETGQMLEPQSIYLGEASGGKPTWNTRVCHIPTYLKAVEGRTIGDIDAETAAYEGFTPEFADVMAEARYQYKTAGAVTSDDFAAVRTVNVMTELLNTTYKDTVLEQSVLVVQTPSLHLDIDTYDKFTAYQDVEEGVIVPTRKGALSRQSLDLRKDVAHLQFTDEVLMRGYDQNVYQVHIENAVNDLRRIKEKKIATILETATDDSGADFGARTGGLSNADPYDVIGTTIDTITANDGIVDTFASADKVVRDFMGNSNVKGQFAAGAPQEVGARVVNNIQGFSGITWYISNELTPTILSVYDKRAVVLAQGPTKVAQYRNEEGGFEGYISRDWNAVKIVQAGKIRNITGVTA